MLTARTPANNSIGLYRINNSQTFFARVSSKNIAFLRREKIALTNEEDCFNEERRLLLRREKIALTKKIQEV